MTQPANAYIVLAEFTVDPARATDFLEACAYDAQHSVQDEPGCHTFNAHIPADSSPGAPTTVVLYEVYTDRAAFEAHLQTPHYAVFAEAVQRLHVQTVSVRFFTLQPAAA